MDPNEQTDTQSNRRQQQSNVVGQCCWLHWPTFSLPHPQ